MYNIINLITNEGKDTRNLALVNEMINETGDDRNGIHPSDSVILIVEDDLRFGKIIAEKAHEMGMKAVIAVSYLDVFDFITRFSPVAITLDVKLPDTSGWKVLDILRNDLNYRHIPVYLISGEENKVLALRRGARDFLMKPLDNEKLNKLFHDIETFKDKKKRSVLVIEDNELDSSQIAKILRSDQLSIYIAPTGKKALKQ